MALVDPVSALLTPFFMLEESESCPAPSESVHAGAAALQEDLSSAPSRHLCWLMAASNSSTRAFGALREYTQGTHTHKHAHAHMHTHTY